MTSLDDLRSVFDEWLLLYEKARTANPYLHPSWQLAWAEDNINRSDVRALVVRQDGQLVAVAPFHVVRDSKFGLTVFTHLELFGAGVNSALTELPGVLSEPEHARSVMRDIVRALYSLADKWDWAQLTLSPTQGWLEPQWLPEPEIRGAGFSMHKGSRACVVMPLGDNWDVQRSGLKRNLKESLRRGINRLKREGFEWSISSVSAVDEMPAAIDRLIDLHTARSSMEDTVKHTNSLASPESRNTLHKAAAAMAAGGNARCYELTVGLKVVASLLVLSGGGCTYTALSGMHPDFWNYGCVTTLQGEAAKDAIERGDTVMNLSAGPSVAKLRWSEELDVYQDFLISGPTKRASRAFAAYLQLSAALKFRRERSYQP